jgi:hypothetical protein
MDRCIYCGSHNVVPFHGDTALTYDDEAGHHVGKHPTGFIHPGCGGEFWAHGMEIRYMYGVRRFRFRVDGAQIHEVQD